MAVKDRRFQPPRFKPPRLPFPRVPLPRFRIRTKFIGILIIAAVLPLCIALAAAQLLGYGYYRKAQGMLFQNRAEEIARGLSISVERQIEAVTDWMEFFDLAERLRAPNSSPDLLEKELTA